MLVAVKHDLVNLWKVVREGENGAIPEVLSGWYTSETHARRAILHYEGSKEEVIKAKVNRDVEAELWKKAKTIKGKPSKVAFEELMAEHLKATTEATVSE